MNGFHRLKIQVSFYTPDMKLEQVTITDKFAFLDSTVPGLELFVRRYTQLPSVDPTSMANYFIGNAFIMRYATKRKNVEDWIIESFQKKTPAVFADEGVYSLVGIKILEARDAHHLEDDKEIFVRNSFKVIDPVIIDETVWNFFYQGFNVFANRNIGSFSIQSEDGGFILLISRGLYRWRLGGKWSDGPSKSFVAYPAQFSITSPSMSSNPVAPDVTHHITPEPGGPVYVIHYDPNENTRLKAWLRQLETDPEELFDGLNPRNILFGTTEQRRAEFNPKVKYLKASEDMVTTAIAVVDRKIFLDYAVATDHHPLEDEEKAE